MTIRRKNPTSLSDPSRPLRTPPATDEDTFGVAGGDAELRGSHDPIQLPRGTDAKTGTAVFAELVADLRQRSPDSHMRQMDVILRHWCVFLEDLEIQRTPHQLQTDPVAWDFITGEILRHYHQYLLNGGYTTATINRHLTRLRALIHLADQAGGITNEAEIVHMLGIRGYHGRRGRQLNLQGQKEGNALKRDVDVGLSSAQVANLKHRHTATAQGWRDALLMCILLDHGLKVWEITSLTVQDFDLSTGVFHIPSRKGLAGRVQTLSRDTLHAVRAYLGLDNAPVAGLLFRSIKKKGTLGKRIMQTRHITERVYLLGKQVAGLPNLTPKDCRHYWKSIANPPNTDSL